MRLQVNGSSEYELKVGKKDKRREVQIEREKSNKAQDTANEGNKLKRSAGE